jgi:hypothetical protein
LLEPCEKISAGGKPLDLRVYRDRDRIQEIESDVVGNKEGRGARSHAVLLRKALWLTFQ